MTSVMEKSFYPQGLRFSCARCSACCRFESGFVFLSEADLRLLAQALEMDYSSCMETFCRWVPWGDVERLSLKEKANFDCILWRGGCSVYDARPLQCRAYPFWPDLLSSRAAWDEAARDCPGMGQGAAHSRETIAAWLAEQRRTPPLTRPWGGDA